MKITKPAKTNENNNGPRFSGRGAEDGVLTLVVVL